MKPLLRTCTLLASLLLLPLTARAVLAPSAERVAAAAALAFGRLPPPDELAAFAAPVDDSVAVLLARHRRQLAGDAALRLAVATRAWSDVFGRAPTAEEVRADPADAPTYAERVQHHLAWLTAHPADYRVVLDRAYQRIVHRPAFDEEVAYWQAHSPTALSTLLLLGCLDDWARRNQPGLMGTTGTPTVSIHCAHFATLRLSAAVAAEARLALASALAPAFVTGRNLIAPGAEVIATAGGMNFLAVGLIAVDPPPHP